MIMDKTTFEVPSQYKDDLEHLRGWIYQQPHLTARTDDLWLYIFLRGCKFSLQRAKEKIDNFYTSKSAIPEVFGNRDPSLPEIQDILNLGLLLPIPKTKKNEPRYFFHRCKFADPDKILFTDVIKEFYMIADIVFMEDIEDDDGTQYLLCDLDGLSMKHVLQMTPTLSIKLVTFLRKGYPGRPQGFYFLNTPSIFCNMLNIITPVLGKKLSDRIKMFRTYDIIDIPHSVLPKDLGGAGKTLYELQVEWKEKVEKYKDWFLEDTKYGCDESKRLKPMTQSDLFGMEGTFKNLSID